MDLLGIDIGGSSVKAAAVRDGAVEWTGKSTAYARPARGELERAIAAVRAVANYVGEILTGR